MRPIRELYRNESGATMVEYALMLALIAIVCVAAVALFGNRVAATHQSNAEAVEAVARQACTDVGKSWDAATSTCVP